MIVKWKRISVWWLSLLALAIIAACADNRPTASLPDSFVDPRGDAFVFRFNDGASNDLGALPDTDPIDEEAPSIEILDPGEDEIVIGAVTRIRAKIIDPDGIDAQSVSMTFQGSDESVSLGLSATQDIYEVLVDLSGLSGPARAIISAADLLGNKNTVVRSFSRDPGPIVVFTSPRAEERYTGSLSLQFTVADPGEVTSVVVRLGSQEIPVKKVSSAENQAVYTATIAFDDPVFGIPLSGRQVLTASAQNANGAQSTQTRAFVVDNEGPQIKVVSHKAGQLIGGVIQIVAEFTDPAGVVPATVTLVVGNDLETRSVKLTPDGADPKTYRGQFDTRTLSDGMLFPILAFRAADTLNNENHFGVQVDLDNGPPLISLDPPTSYHHMNLEEGRRKCSRAFDPVGADAVNDGNSVPEVIKVRVRAEDQGNFSPTSPVIPVATVDPETVRLYFLSQSIGKPLIVDSDGDTYCDAINPDVIPLGSNPRVGEAVAINLGAIPPKAEADFRPPVDLIPIAGACDEPGDKIEAPEALCQSTSMHVVTFSTVDKTEPAIYAIPPISPSSALRCVGSPFDFVANNIPDGWVCVAVSAQDKVGNLGVSRPMRLWVDRTSSGRKTSPPASAGPPPDCTGTFSMSTGLVTATACKTRPNTRRKSCSDSSVCGPQGRCLKSSSGVGTCRPKWPQVFLPNEVVRVK